MIMEAFFKKVLIPVLAPSFRSPSGVTGWVARKLMLTTNPPSTQVGIQRLGLQSTDVFVELGAGGGAGLQTILAADSTNVPSQIHLVEISEQFRSDLQGILNEQDATNKLNVQIHGDDCKHMPFLEDNSVDKMFAMNVVYFLDPLPEYLQEIHRVLKPDGGVVVFGCKFAHIPKDEPAVFVNVEQEPVVQAMEQAGFQVTTEFIEVAKDEPGKNYVEVKGIKQQQQQSTSGGGGGEDSCKADE